MTKVMGKKAREGGEKNLGEVRDFQRACTFVSMKRMHDAVILLSISIWFWQLLNKNMQLLSLLICCADQLT